MTYLAATNLVEGASREFQMFTFVIFALAVFHTLFANVFTTISERIAAAHAEKVKDIPGASSVSFRAEILHFFGEVEIIFGLWVIPLLIAIMSFYDWESAVQYVESRDFVEPLFVIVIMSLASTKPIVKLAESGLKLFARLFGGTSSGWWISILTLGPILGSFITEAAAMTLCALLLSRRFFAYAPSKKLAYGTLGLLFVNISVGGLLTNFAAPPVIVVARAWELSSSYMFLNFGWKALIGIVIVNTCYFLFFRKELRQLEKIKHLADFEDEESLDIAKKTPAWITIVHVLFLVVVVMTSHYSAIFLGTFLLFLGFHQATSPHQSPVQLKRPLFVGLFLAALLIHGGLQGWWITPLLGALDFPSLMAVSMSLTAFNDNAAVIYLASLIPDLTEALKYAVLSGVVIGGGLTVIANAPNPAGLVILKKYFKGKVSPLYLFVGAAFPTAVFFLLFYFLNTHPK